MKKRVLFLAPKTANLYSDILQEIRNQGYDVTYVEDRPFDFLKIFGEPANVNLSKYNHIKSKLAKRIYNNWLWRNYFKTQKTEPYYDILFVIDGFRVCDYLIKKLQSYNPNIQKVLYLWDSVQTAVKLDGIFKFFNIIYTFDIEDAEKYSINLLPIYWIPSTAVGEHFDAFGYARFGWDFRRYDVYKAIADMASVYNLKTYIKLLAPPQPKNIFMKLVKKYIRKDYSLEVDKSILSNELIDPNKYREMINSSNVIIDALNNIQTGQTTRFGWAIGAGKRIITNNKAVSKYPFYDEDEIYIYSPGDTIPKKFFVDDFEQKEWVKNEVEKFRIDNWVKTMLTC